jgi:hypothetical protein
VLVLVLVDDSHAAADDEHVNEHVHEHVNVHVNVNEIQIVSVAEPRVAGVVGWVGAPTRR